MANVQEAIALLGFEGEKANLDRVVKTSGEGWSLGEKQLVSAAASFVCAHVSCVCVCFQVCLARVIVRKPQILFMDEVRVSISAHVIR